MHFACRSFIGKANLSFWSQFWEAEPDDSKKGHLFGLVVLSSVENQDLPQHGRHLLENIRQNYFSSSATTDPLTSLTQIIPPIIDSCQTYLSSLVLVVTYQSRAFLYVYGPASVAIARNGIVSLLLTSQDQQSKTISGPLQDQDRLFLFSHQFRDLYTWDCIKSDLVNPDLNQIEDNIFLKLNEATSQDLLAASLININIDSIQPELVIESAPPQVKRKVSLPSFNFKKTRFSSPISTSVVVKKNKKINLAIAFLLLFLLSASIFLGFKKNQAQQTESRYQQLEQDLTKKLTDATAVANLNLDSAKSLGQEAEAILASMSALNIHPDQIDSFRNQIQDLLKKSGQSQALSLDSLYDTTFIADNLEFSHTIIAGDLIYLVDTKNNRIDTVNVDQKSTQNIIQNDDVNQIIAATVAQDQLFFVTPTILYQVKNKQLLTRYNLSESTTITSAPIDLASWGDSLYLLTSDNIYKFSLTDISNPQTWLETDQTMPTNLISLAINGKVWLQSKDGQITPFLRGQKDNFAFKDQSIFTSATSLFVTQDSDLLAFIDQPNLVYVYQKDGLVKAKYNLGDQKALDLVIHESSSRLLILASDQKIYQIPLN